MMVCPYDENRLLLILQVDHSKVTGWFAAHWGNDQFARPSPYAAMVLAAQEHDTGWWDWEIKPQINIDCYDFFSVRAATDEASRIQEMF
jgi:uncharacterized protein DUF3891